MEDLGSASRASERQQDGASRRSAGQDEAQLFASAGHSAQILEMLDAQGPAVARQFVAKDAVAAFADGFGQLRLQFEGSPPHALALGFSQQAPQQCRLAAP
jgi:hypothetical protein